MTVINLQYYDIDGSKKSYPVSGEPDKCPICKYNVAPVVCWVYFIKGQYPYNDYLETIYRCPRRDCGHLFLAYFYRRHYHALEPPKGPFTLDALGLPLFREVKEFPEVLNKISPKFQVIYNQAMLAEGNKLFEICGPGYGKALEFLVKDYLIKLEPEKEEEIKKMKLGEAVSKIDDSKIKICAEKAAWLRNDETHYVRRWEDKDIENFKELIWIEASEITKKYEIEMEKRK